MKNLLLLLTLPAIAFAIGSTDRTLKTEIITSDKTNQDITITPTGTGDVVLKAYSGVLKASTGTLSASNVDLASEITGVLPIANGGTNSSSTLSSNLVMTSVGGAIVENANVSVTELERLDGLTSDIVELVGTQTITGNKTLEPSGSGVALQITKTTTGNALDIDQTGSGDAINASGQVSIAGRLNVTSATLASNPCPDMTTAERDAIVSPTAGDCVYNETTSALNVYTSSWQALAFSVTPSVYEHIDIIDDNSNFSLSGNGWIIPTTNKSERGTDLLTMTTPTYSIFTANQDDVLVTISSSAWNTVATSRIKIIVNASTVVYEGARNFQANDVIQATTNIILDTGDYFRIEFDSGAFRGVTDDAYVRITAKKM